MWQIGTSPPGRHPPSGHRCLPSENHGMALPLPCSPAVPIDVHLSHLAVGEIHSNSHWRELSCCPAAAAQLCITSSMGWCLQVAQRAAALSEVHMHKSQSAWSPQRNLIKENIQPCWFCSAARSFLFALHKSQASRFGPIFPNLFSTRKYWNRDLRRHWGSIPHWRICFALQLLRLLLES